MTRLKPLFASALCAAAFLTAPVLAAIRPAPVIGDQPIHSAPHPFDEDADAASQVASAFDTARRTGRNVLIEFGANWCPDCRLLNGVLALAPVHAWIDEAFVPVTVDVGRFTKNLDIAAQYGVKLHAIPAVFVVTPAGELLNGDNLTALTDARTMSGQAIVDQLANWAKR